MATAPVPQTPCDVRRNAQALVEHLEQLSKTRPLKDAEVISLVQAMKRAARDQGETVKGQRPWTEGQKYRLLRYLMRGKKPAEIAILMDRTERAIWRKMTEWRWTVAMFCPPDVPTPSRLRTNVQSQERRYAGRRG